MLSLQHSYVSIVKFSDVRGVQDKLVKIAFLDEVLTTCFNISFLLGPSCEGSLDVVCDVSVDVIAPSCEGSLDVVCDVRQHHTKFATNLQGHNFCAIMNYM